MPLRIVVIMFFVLLSGCYPRTPAAQDNQSLASANGKALAHSTGCTNCHDISRNLVGPSFIEIAQRYQGQSPSHAENEILKIFNIGPSSDRAVSRALGPHSLPSEEEAKIIIQWILSLAEEPER